MGLFGKKKVAEHQAAGAFVVGVLQHARGAWPMVVEQHKALLAKKGDVLADDAWAAFEFAVAVLVVESQAIANVLPADQAERVVSFVLRSIDSPDLKGQGSEAFGQYSDAWTGALEDNEMPFNAVAAVLYDRLELDAQTQIGEQAFKDPLIIMALGAAVVSTGGGWWKRFLNDNRLVS